MDLIILRFSLISCTLYIKSQPKTKENWINMQSVGQRILVIGRVLLICWVALSERTVKAVWENYRVLQTNFSNAAGDVNQGFNRKSKIQGTQ